MIVFKEDIVYKDKVCRVWIDEDSKEEFAIYFHKEEWSSGLVGI